MSIAGMAESHVEELALEVFAELGYEVLHGPDIAPNEPASERSSYSDVALVGRLDEAIRRLNPRATEQMILAARRAVVLAEAASLVENNRRFHALLRDGVEIEVALDGGEVRGERLRLFDFDDPNQNDWLVVNQFTVVEGSANRRPDIVVFINGLPLGVIELKSATDEDATIESAYNQLQTYKQQVPTLFQWNEVLVISDGLRARISTISGSWERFAPWRTVDGSSVASHGELEMTTLLQGVFHKRLFLELVRGFVVFEEERSGIIKKLAGYHQFHAVRTALAATVRATRVDGDRRVGVVWHTQGSGKSLTMSFYAGRVVQEPAMENPTLVVITDRNDLDEQLFATFSRCADLLRQKPVQARDRSHLRELLQVASGGVVFTTIQKFLPEERGDRFAKLSDRANVVVIADEAHRSQYGFASRYVESAEGAHLVAGFAQHMRDALPHASFIGFTGTPVEATDKNTRAVFGEYISIYDIQRAVQDGATVPIYYESRLANLDLDGDLKGVIDSEFEQLTEREEASRKEKIKSKWAALEAIVGDEKRVAIIAKDIVQHFEARTAAMAGKAMIVCMSRRICVDVYEALRALRPEWHDDEDGNGAIKVVMTGGADDPLTWQPHIRSKARLTELAERFKNPGDPLKIVIVRDMWLTGFDAPCLHTLYVDKPMRGHGLMQAIARVNRVYQAKPGGLVVDYLGLAENLRKALANYTESGGKGDATLDVDEAVAVMLEKIEVCRNLFHGFDYSIFFRGTPIERLKLLPSAQNHVFELENGCERLVQAVLELSKAHALASGRDEAVAVAEEVAFFKAVKAAVAKTSGSDSGRSDADFDHAIRQIISKAIVTDGVVDVFAAAGLNKPNVSILSDEFLEDVRNLPHKNLAVELLRKLLSDDLKQRRRTNLVQSEAFSEKLERAIASYRNRAVETVQVIEELLAIAREMQNARKRGEELRLGDAELAFFDALQTNDSAVAVMGDAILADIARALTDTIRRSVTLDWRTKETVRARLRVAIRKQLAKSGYPPDKTKEAVETVIRQAELMAEFDGESFAAEIEKELGVAAVAPLSPEFTRLQHEVARVELGLRALLLRVLGDDVTLVPGHVFVAVEARVEKERSAKPWAAPAKQQPLASLLAHFDLREIQQTITTKTLWSRFESFFTNKERVEHRFDQLAHLRNPLAHNRAPDAQECADGEAALRWFNATLAAAEPA
jgi:type I restriction enzyme R subunit